MQLYHFHRKFGQIKLAKLKKQYLCPNINILFEAKQHFEIYKDSTGIN